MQAQKLKVRAGVKVRSSQAPPLTHSSFLSVFVLVGLCRPLLHPSHSCGGGPLSQRTLLAVLTPVSGMGNIPRLRVPCSL